MVTMAWWWHGGRDCGVVVVAVALWLWQVVAQHGAVAWLLCGCGMVASHGMVLHGGCCGCDMVTVAWWWHGGHDLWHGCCG